MPKATVRLCEVNANDEISEAPAFDLPISDHDVIVGTNKHGTFGTWNILNANSPVSPGFCPAGITGLRRLHHKEEIQEHIRLVAQMIIDLFQNGVDALALQEVPAKNEQYFEEFVRQLHKISQENGIELDFDSFNESYAQTRKPLKKGADQGYHGFATALLFKKRTFTLSQISALAGERGSSYVLKSTKSNEAITLLNIHGDYGQADKLATEIASALVNPDTMILGDSNIALTKEDAMNKLKQLKGVVVEPSSNREDTPDSLRTLDCFVTNIQTSYIFNSACKNYAASPSVVSDSDSSLFAHKPKKEGPIDTDSILNNGL